MRVLVNWEAKRNETKTKSNEICKVRKRNPTKRNDEICKVRKQNIMERNKIYKVREQGLSKILFCQNNGNTEMLNKCPRDNDPTKQQNTKPHLYT